MEGADGWVQRVGGVEGAKAQGVKGSRLGV